MPGPDHLINTKTNMDQQVAEGLNDLTLTPTSTTTNGEGNDHEIDGDIQGDTDDPQPPEAKVNGDHDVQEGDDDAKPEMNESCHSSQDEVEEVSEESDTQGRPPTLIPPAPVWSWSTTFGQRQLNLLRFGFFSDFTLLLGQEKQKVLVHKAVIASSSIVMYNSVLKVLSEGVNVLELDDDPRIFTLFLQYLYTGESGVRTWSDAFSLQKLAKKYQVPDLVKQCEIVIDRAEFTPPSAFALLPLALSHAHETLLSALLNYICKNGSAFVKDKRFLTLPESAVLEILKRDDLAVKHEMEVLSAVVLWGQAQCRVKKLDDTNPANFGPLINPFLRHIRFPCDFAPKFWLPYLEKDASKNTSQILRDIFSPRHIFNPYNKTVRRFSEPMCLVHSRYPGDGNNGLLVQWRCKNPRQRFNETLMFLVNFPFTFFGFSLVRGIFGEDFEKSVYDYSDLIVKTTVITNHSVSPVVEVYVVESETTSELRVHFQQPIDVPANKAVSMIICLSGSLKFKQKTSGGGFNNILVSNCDVRVGTGMIPDHNTTLIPTELKMILPIMCEFRRASAGRDQLPIDKGYIESLLFSLNRPHPQGNDTSRQQTNHLPCLRSFE